MFGLSQQKNGEIEKLILPEHFAEFVDPPNQLPFVTFGEKSYFYFNKEFPDE